MPGVSLNRKTAFRFIVCLGIVSLFADMTYEGARSALGPFLKDLGMSAAFVGIISGFGEMLAASLRYFSGRFADRTRAYWTIVISGYALNVIVIPGLAFIHTWVGAAILISLERTGKAIRGPARDVLLSSATETVGHGKGFGLHAAMDQTGAIIGPLIVAVMVARSHAFGPAFLLLAIPAILTMTSLLVARHFGPGGGAPPKHELHDSVPRLFWIYVLAAGLLACGFADFPLLAYHFQNLGIFAPATIPLLYAAANGVSGLVALICGHLFDRYGITVLGFGILVTMLMLPLGFLGGPVAAGIATLCWGAGLGVQDATLRSGISQVVSMKQRGYAFGAFNGGFGVLWFAGSAIMGVLYNANMLGGVVAFGLTFQIAAAGMFFALRRPLAKAIGR